MTWLRVDDGFTEHPKIRGLSNDAFRLHITGLCYCARNLTDGLISRLALRSVGSNANLSRPGTTARTLVRAGLWHPEADGYRIHDYLAYNPAKADVDKERAAARERMQRRRSGERYAERSGERTGERSGEVRGPRPDPSVNKNGSSTTWHPSRGVRDPAKAIHTMIANGAITTLADLQAELRAAGLNGDTAATLIHELEQATT